MPIESGPTTERIIRNSLFLLTVLILAGWFCYDGWVGYPRRNLREHLEQLPPQDRAKIHAPKIYPAVVESTFAAAREALKRIDIARQREGLVKLYGGPPSFESANEWLYFGPYHRVRIPLIAGRATEEPILQPCDKSAVEIMTQRIIAVGLAVLSVYMIVFIVRVVRTRAVLDEGGLVFRGKGPIRWGDMLALDIRRFQEKGWVELAYNDYGVTRKLRLDEYHLARFDEIIDELCRRKGFENPLPVRHAPDEAPAS